MKHYTASYNAGETSKNVRAFVKEHHNYFIDLLKTVGPYLLILFIVSIVLQQYAIQDLLESAKETATQIKAATEGASTEEKRQTMIEASAGQQNAAFTNRYMLMGYVVHLGIGYLFAVIAISWHRLILLGKENYQPMKIFEPQKHEIDFLITLAMISAVIPFALSFLMINTIGIESSIYALILPLMILLIYAYYKISFYFPAKAVNTPITFKESFYLTKGYFWKIISGYWLAAWRVSLMLFGAIFLLQLASTPLLLMASGNEESTIFSKTLILQSLLYTPIVLYFQPLLTVIAVSVLSNYYQYALQNKSLPET